MKIETIYQMAYYGLRNHGHTFCKWQYVSEAISDLGLEEATEIPARHLEEVLAKAAKLAGEWTGPTPATDNLNKIRALIDDFTEHMTYATSELIAMRMDQVRQDRTMTAASDHIGGLLDSIFPNLK